MKLNLLVIRSANIHESAKLYTLFGLQFEYHQHGKGAWHYSAIINGTVFEIYPLLKRQEQADVSTRLGFEVENLDELMLKLREEDITIMSPPSLSEFGYIAVIKDLDGRKIELKGK